MTGATLAMVALLVQATMPPQPSRAPGPPVPRSSGAAITLAELEQLAIQNNPTTTGAAAGIDAARARARQAGAWPNPTVGYDGEDLNGGRGEHGFFVDQTIPLFGKLRLSRDVFEKSVDQAEALRELQRLRILSSVRQTFYEVLVVERKISVQERLAALASEAVGVTAQLYNVGAADKPDFLEIEIESRRVQLQLNRSKNELFALRSHLAALTGVREIAARPLAGSIDTAIPELAREQAIRTILEQSPELRAARAALERARAVTARERREPYPDLFVRAGAQHNRERDHDTGRPLGWAANVEAGVSLPLWNRNRGATAAARAEETRAQSEVTRLELALESRANAQYATYLTMLRSAEAYRMDILPRAEEAYRLYLARYREMAAAYPQVLVAQRTLFEMSGEYLESLEDAWRAALNLQGLLAGDGLDAPAPTGEGIESARNGRGGER